MVYTADLKSAASNGLRVRVPPLAPKNIMWKIISGKTTLNSSPTLEDALNFAKNYGEFVTITDGTIEFIGKFGVDEVKDPNYDGWISRKKKS